MKLGKLCGPGKEIPVPLFQTLSHTNIFVFSVVRRHAIRKGYYDTNRVTVSPDTEITQAARLLLEKGFNGLPVVDEGGMLVGILCQKRPDCTAKEASRPLLSSHSWTA